MAFDDGDISARFRQLQGRESGPQAGAQPRDLAESYRVRGRMLGVLLRDARLNARRRVEDCARVLNIAPDDITAWEYGERVPTLPQLEILAYYLEVPVSQFWATETLEAQRNGTGRAQDEYIALRTRMIGALLRQAREQAGLSLEALSAASGLPAGQIERYELGEAPLPMHELTVLAGAVHRNIDDFLESSSYVGELLARREAWKQFAEMPADVREFAANPINVGFVRIAMMLSHMPADQLREMGETMLEITY